MGISVSGKHFTGHAIYFPSDSPSKVADVLPRVDADGMPRVTFTGPGGYSGKGSAPCIPFLWTLFTNGGMFLEQ
jgi:hypothetical protein